MSNYESEEQLRLVYQLIMTPLSITSSTSPTKSPSKSSSKSILLKLGSKSIKWNAFNVAEQFQIDVIYSKTLQKFCPVKGIIKIYDVTGGNQIISCVGSFQIEELLQYENHQTYQKTIQKEIGTSKLTLHIKTAQKQSSKLKQQKKEKQLQKSDSKDQLRNSRPFGSAPLSKQDSRSRLGVLKQSEYIMNRKKERQDYFRNTSKSINKSIDKINQALGYKKYEFRTPVQSQQSSQIREVEDDGNLNMKVQKLKTELIFLESNHKDLLKKCQELVSNINVNQNNQYCLEDDSSSKVLKINHKGNDFQTTFKRFITCVKSQTKSKTFEIQSQNLKGPEIEKLNKDIQKLKAIEITKEKQIQEKVQKIGLFEAQIKQLKQKNRFLNEENCYIREKNDQVELSIFNKETAIQSLKKKLDHYGFQLQQLESKLCNSELQIQELREQASIQAQTIDKYVQKYGQLKKNKAIQLQIKDCLRWIDQQNRDLEMSEFQQTIPSYQEDKNDSGSSLSSVIRNIEIDKVPIQEMSVIRNQLIKILQKVDTLLNK